MDETEKRRVIERVKEIWNILAGIRGEIDGMETEHPELEGLLRYIVGEVFQDMGFDFSDYPNLEPIIQPILDELDRETSV